LVAFSRKVVLGLKAELEKEYHRTVSVVYGNLPPEVRLNQAERFAKGQTELCVATDAVGMGLNLPADNVCFYETSKFDGKDVRPLTPHEIRQIGGRAGRYGLSEKGWMGALSPSDLEFVRKAIDAPYTEVGFAYVAPTPESIALLPGKLSEKLQKWVELAGIPPRWKEILKPVDLSSQIELAGMLSPGEVRRLGEETALLLINAPSYRDTESYWLRCARSIVNQQEMPLVSYPPQVIKSAKDLEATEIAIRGADIYLWLSQREEFAPYASEADKLREKRYQWTMEVDAALQRRVDTTRRCKVCGRSLPVGSRYDTCNHCHNERQWYHPF
jgi:ATP-dependent RNA helicase SUPV3L1/SUV3